MAKINDEFNAIRLYQIINEACVRNGFIFSNGSDDCAVIIANHPPYANDTVICRASSFKEALQFMNGYEQHKFEVDINK